MDCNITIADFEQLTPLMQECWQNGSRVVVTVTGNSMRPFICHLRDQVVLVPCDGKKLQRGDVPLYKRADGKLALHRVVAQETNAYVLCGDAQTEKEYGVSYTAILAKAAGFYRRGKYISCDALRYRVYWHLWLLCMPIRPQLLKCWLGAHRLVARCRCVLRK